MPERRRAPLVALFAANAVSLSGNALARVAIPWFVLVTTGSPALTGLAAFFEFLPMIVAGIFGGAIVDRLGFRKASVLADVASAVAVAAIPALHLTVGIELWQLFALVFLGALLDAPGATARRALVPDVAELAAMRLERATGIGGAIDRGSLLVGAPLGGVLVAAVGATAALWVNAASFLVSAALVAAAVPRPRLAQTAADGRRYFAELTEGIRFVARDRLIRAVVLTVLVTNFLDAPWTVVMSVFTLDAFGTAVHLGLIVGTFGAFALLGSLVFGAIGHRLPRRTTFAFSFFVAAFPYLVLSTLPPFAATLALMVVWGLAVSPINPILQTVSYERVPVDMRGRVFGVATAGAYAAIPAGALLGGLVVEWVGVQATLFAIGACYLAVTAFGLVNPAFREMDATPPAVPARSTSA